MIKTFIIILLLSCNSFAKYLSINDQGTVDVLEYEPSEDDLKPVLTGADDVQPNAQKSTLLTASTPNQTYEVLLPQVYRIDIFFDGEVGKGDIEKGDTSTKTKEPLEDIEVVVLEADKPPKNTSNLMDGSVPAFKINDKIQTPSDGSTSTTESPTESPSTTVSTTPTPTPTTTPTESKSTTEPKNETKPVKSFLQQIEEELGITTDGNGSNHLTESIFTLVTMLIIVMLMK